MKRSRFISLFVLVILSMALLAIVDMVRRMRDKGASTAAGKLLYLKPF